MPPTSSTTNPLTGHKEGIVLILSGPSGSGKTTLCNRLRETLPQLKFNISYTTRSPRINEIDGKDYFFVSKEKFQNMRERGDFLEWTFFSDNFYGTSFESIKKSRQKGNDIILELDLQGVETLRELKYPGIYIFLLPPSLDALSFRLNDRSTESEKIIKQRLERGIKEIKSCMEYDYIIISHEVEKSVVKLISIYTAEKLRTSRFVPESAVIQALLKGEEKD